MKHLLPCLLIAAVVIVGMTLISAQPAEGARIRVFPGYPYRPYVVRYRAPYYRPFVPLVPPPIVRVPAYYPPPVAVFPRYPCVVPPPPVVVPAPHYEVW